MKLIHSEAARPSRSVCLLGASGSVGSTAIRYMRRNPEIRPTAISVHRSTDLLRSLLKEFSSSIRLAGISHDATFQNDADSLRAEFPQVRFFGGASGIVDLVRESDCDTVLTAVVGAAGIDATVEAVRRGCKIALANKETLVTAGPAIQREAEKARASGLPVCFLPVDSEHNAAFQLLEGMQNRRLRSLILTASGGPFFLRSLDEIRHVSRDEVLNHPTWKMGPKISVDSAGMINKGLEMIEAHFLFDLGYDRLEVRIHRDSYVHAMVRTTDGGMLLAASAPDMVFPVAHALCYPDPVPVEHAPIDCVDWPALSFSSVDEQRYPGFRVCLQAGKRGGTAPAILNAANEVAVQLFLDGGLLFHQIPDAIEATLQSVAIEDGDELGLFQEADRKARAFLLERHGRTSIA